ncbi:MAG: RNA polymerase sigma factor SigZ [Dehalococcoidia bacterium]
MVTEVLPVETSEVDHKTEPVRISTDTDRIWEEFNDRLRKFILRRVRNEHDAEDILQDVFSRIHVKLPTLQKPDRLESWVYQITRNAIIDYYRRQARAPLDLSEVPERATEPVVAEDVSEDILVSIKVMIDYLPDKYKQALALTEYQGLTQKEMSQQLGISFSGAKSRVQRAREKLKETMLSCCYFEFDRLGNIIDYRPKAQTCPYRCRAG